jgi:hypothetical protein
MEAEPEVYLGTQKLNFYLDFLYYPYIEKIRSELADEHPEPATEDDPYAFEHLVAARYQERLAVEMEASTGFQTNPSPITGRETGGPGVGFDPLPLLGLLGGVSVVVASINDWADLAGRVRRAFKWLKSKADGEDPIVSDGVALIFGSDALRKVTRRRDLAPAFVSEINQYPPRGGDDPPAQHFDFLVGARSKRYLYLCRVSDVGVTTHLGRVRFDGGAIRSRRSSKVRG